MGSDDDPDGHYVLLIWDLTNLTMIHAFKCHRTGIFQIQSFGDVIVTRDKDGTIVLWNAELASDDTYEDTEENLVLMRKIELPCKDKVLSIDTDLRRLAIGRIGGTTVLDFWDSSSPGQKFDNGPNSDK